VFGTNSALDCASPAYYNLLPDGFLTAARPRQCMNRSCCGLKVLPEFWKICGEILTASYDEGNQAVV
jgi:hypothetical protein